MSTQPVKLLGKEIAPIGFGLMGLTWRFPPQPAAASFKTMDTALSQGLNFWNGGELYGTPERHSCHLLNEYFTQHPEHAYKVVLSIKGGTEPGGLKPDGSAKNVRRSVEECLRVLDGTKTIDLFECARVDPTVPFEETMETLAELVREGKIGGIGLSEVKASTVERAHKIHPIAAVEVELSLWATDILENGVAETCARLGIPVVAYSPLARGALTDTPIRSNAEIPDTDFRKHLPKFQDDALEYNNRITDEVAKLADRKGVTRAQIAISWVAGLSGRSFTNKHGNVVKIGTIVPIPGATTSERVVENSTLVTLTEDEFAEIEDLLRNNPTVGARYPAAMSAVLEG